MSDLDATFPHANATHLNKSSAAAATAQNGRLQNDVPVVIGSSLSITFHGPLRVCSHCWFNRNETRMITIEGPPFSLPFLPSAAVACDWQLKRSPHAIHSAGKCGYY